MKKSLPEVIGLFKASRIFVLTTFAAAIFGLAAIPAAAASVGLECSENRGVQDCARSD
ncbi:MAG: hypothetical protein IK094_03825 [Treponema sp.]|nr:hypothetical protein [Treponema sp.]